MLRVVLPEYKDKQNQEREENGHVVHGAQHHEQLAPQVGHEAHQFQDAEQTERP